jgi:hypothetical protein
MKSLMKLLAATLVLSAALTGTSALAQNANVSSQNPAELAGYHTYSFRNLYTTDAMVEPRLAGAIDRNLQIRGWKELPQDGEVLITAVLADNHDRRLYKSFYSTLDNLDWNVAAATEPGAIPASVTRAPAGTLIVDMYDSFTGALIWRGTAGDFLSANTGDNGLKVDDAVTHMLNGVPYED